MKKADDVRLRSALAELAPPAELEAGFCGGAAPEVCCCQSNGLGPEIPGVWGARPNAMDVWVSEPQGSRTKDSYSRASLCSSMRRSDLPVRSLKSMPAGP